MKKLLQLVRIEKYPGPRGGVQLSFVPYKPETEPVNPAKESFDKMKRALKEKGRELPSDLEVMFDGLTDMMVGSPGTSGPMAPTSGIIISVEEYERLGKPTVEALVSMEINVEKEPE